MKKEYDFSHGVRGKFFRKNAVLNIPVYLDSKAMGFVADIASKRRMDISRVVNDLIHEDIRRTRSAG